MKIVSSAVMRELDRRAIEEYKIKGTELMDNAGYGVAFHVRRLADSAGLTGRLVHVISGRGNNGGDGFAAARYLKDMGFDVEVWLAGAAAQVTGDAAYFLSKCKSAKIRVEELTTLEDWQYAIDDPLTADLIVDGVLGIGMNGPARGPVAGAIQYIRARADESLIVSIDIPSGLNADTGEPQGDTVTADVTATMGLPKRGLVAPAAIDFVGSIEVVDIGLPKELVAEAEADELEMIYLTDLFDLYPRRRRNTHKGDYGHVVIIGGGGPYTGAVTLAARAAVRSGVGLVTTIVPQSLRATVASAVPEAMVAGAMETAEGGLAESALEVIRSYFGKSRAFVVGPGLTRSLASRKIVETLLHEAPGPLLLDADALAVMAGEPRALRAAANGLVVTPHPGEAAALLKTSPDAVQADRIGAARRLAEETGAVVVLKGAGTLVARQDRPIQVNMTGNPGMAKGGSGDVLSGLLGGLLAQGFDPYDAARVAVYVHGHAGDLGAWRKCQVSLTPGDLIEELPYAFRELSMR
ncbi:MAG: NAD(P)H-hydrate dehydratase [Kiritimatiellae bacterium]|nr:NAD(P)H-hydrate dehydratase [Kiritimatiellia bacterium]MDW8457843.1 NAD(P)H-hydrate dehydratase [Verrucomicrobiota bacterium]